MPLLSHMVNVAVTSPSDPPNAITEKPRLWVSIP